MWLPNQGVTVLIPASGLHYPRLPEGRPIPIFHFALNPEKERVVFLFRGRISLRPSGWGCTNTRRKVSAVIQESPCSPPRLWEQGTFSCFPHPYEQHMTSSSSKEFQSGKTAVSLPQAGDGGAGEVGLKPLRALQRAQRWSAVSSLPGLNSGLMGTTRHGSPPLPWLHFERSHIFSLSVILLLHICLPNLESFRVKHHLCCST